MFIVVEYLNSWKSNIKFHESFYNLDDASEYIMKLIEDKDEIIIDEDEKDNKIKCFEILETRNSTVIEKIECRSGQVFAIIEMS